MDTANPSSQETPTGSELEQTPSVDPTADVSEEVVKSHPAFKKLEDDYSAAEREKNRYKGRLEKAQKGISGEEEKTENPKEETPYATKEDIWELKNAKDVELYGDDEYKKDLETGIPRDYALKTAKLRFQSNPDKARLERQQQMASGTAIGTRNLESDDITAKDREDIAKHGYSEYAVRKQKELKRLRGQL